MLKKAVSVLILGLFVLGFFAGLTSAERVERVVQKTATSPSPYAMHAPIRINSDIDPQWASYPGRVILGYEINGTGYGFCIFIGNCSQAFTIENCYLHHANGRLENYFNNTGIYLYKSSKGILSNNNCSGGNWCGISLWGSNTNTLTNNTCRGNSYSGIRLDSSSYNTLTCNNCSGNGDGIDLYGSGTNALTGNNCSGNWGEGISLHSSTYNTLTGNKLQENKYYGMSISNSTKNCIYHNNFINNYFSTWQAYDDNGTNFWNSSYPCGGNHWYDWTFPDVKKGPNQDQPGSDGIIDLPYMEIYGGAGAKDCYPLTTQIIIPETPLPVPLIIVCVLLLTAIAVRRRP
jgi:parallel beta-helix repeat protein